MPDYKKPRCSLLLTYLLVTSVLPVCAQGIQPDQRSVAALGRLEPAHGIIRLAAPSTPQAISGSVLSKLLVEEGEDVAAGQLLAVTDTEPVMQAFVEEARAELVLATREVEAARSRADEACVRADVAQREADRRTRLRQQGVAGEEEAERAQGEADARAATCTAAASAIRSAEARVAVSRAHLARTEAELRRSRIHAPVAGRVLSITAHPGEMIGFEGLLELAQVQRMYAIAEVFETDIRLVRIGQRATISSTALSGDLEGTVEFIRNKVDKQDEIGTDPAARKDARIIEVGILLDDSMAGAHLTNLQVNVIINP